MLDAACGTADVGLEFHRQAGDSVHVVGIDFAVPMLQLAASKTRSLEKQSAIHLTAADAFQLPFRSAAFDAVSMAFGIRNIRNKAAVLGYFFDCLKPGGRLAILELSIPSSGPLGRAFLFYFNRLLPLLGRFISNHRFAYTYLPASVADFPKAETFAALMREVGFKNVRYRKMTLGIAVLFIGEKPPAACKRNLNKG